MDPWYYLDLDTTIKDNDDDILELNEICDMYPDGSWRLDSKEYDGYIIFRGKEYKSIEYKNSTKILNCAGEKSSETFTLSIS
jgi:hypothetical protein